MPYILRETTPTYSIRENYSAPTMTFKRFGDNSHLFFCTLAKHGRWTTPIHICLNKGDIQSTLANVFIYIGIGFKPPKTLTLEPLELVLASVLDVHACGLVQCIASKSGAIELIYSIRGSGQASG